MANTKQNTIRFKCNRCNTFMRVSVKLAGRYTQCAKCKQRIAVPSSQDEADEEARDYDVKRLAYEVPKNCMKCKQPMAKGAVICTHCGFDYREGRQIVPQDLTIKEGEKMRGMPALQAMIVEFVALLGLIGLFVFRLPDRVWWELGIYLSLLLMLIAFLPMHFMQWYNYRQVPLRDHALKLQEDRAEREEAKAPYGFSTVWVFIGCVLLGFAIALPIFGDETWDTCKDWLKTNAADLKKQVFGESKEKDD